MREEMRELKRMYEESIRAMGNCERDMRRDMVDMMREYVEMYDVMQTTEEKLQNLKDKMEAVGYEEETEETLGG